MITDFNKIEKKFCDIYQKFNDSKKDTYKKILERTEDMLEDEIKNDDIVSAIRFIISLSDFLNKSPNVSYYNYNVVLNDAPENEMYRRILSDIREHVIKRMNDDMYFCVNYIISSWCNEKLSYFEHAIPSIDDLK